MFKLIDQSLLSTKTGHNYWKYSRYSEALDIYQHEDSYYWYKQDPKHWNDLSKTRRFPRFENKEH